VPQVLIGGLSHEEAAAEGAANGDGDGDDGDEAVDGDDCDEAGDGDDGDEAGDGDDGDEGGDGDDGDKAGDDHALFADLSTEPCGDGEDGAHPAEEEGMDLDEEAMEDDGSDEDNEDEVEAEEEPIFISDDEILALHRTTDGSDTDTGDGSLEDFYLGVFAPKSKKERLYKFVLV